MISENLSDTKKKKKFLILKKKKLKKKTTANIKFDGERLAAFPKD